MTLPGRERGAFIGEGEISDGYSRNQNHTIRSYIHPSGKPLKNIEQNII